MKAASGTLISAASDRPRKDARQVDSTPDVLYVRRHGTACGREFNQEHVNSLLSSSQEGALARRYALPARRALWRFARIKGIFRWTSSVSSTPSRPPGSKPSA